MVGYVGMSAPTKIVALNGREGYIKNISKKDPQPRKNEQVPMHKDVQTFKLVGVMSLRNKDLLTHLNINVDIKLNNLS